MFEYDLFGYFKICGVLKTHGYNMFEINEMMPWYLSVTAELIRQRQEEKGNGNGDNN